MFAPRFLVGMTFSIYYGFGALWPFLDDRTGPYSGGVASLLPYFPTAAATSYLCLVGFLVGYENGWIQRVGSRSTLLFWTYSESAIKFLWTLMLVLGATAISLSMAFNTYFQTTTELQTPLFYGAVGFLLNGFYVATVIAVGMAFRSRNRSWRVLAGLTTAFLILMAVPTGSKTMFFIGFMFFAITWNYMAGPFTRRQAVAWFLVGFVALTAMLPFNIAYRDSLLESSSTEQSMSVATSTIATAMQDVADMDLDSLLDLMVDYSGGRFQNISIVAAIIRYQDEGGPLHYGATYGKMLLVVIPRFLWPDKPPITMGQELNRNLFGADSKNVTSVGITMVGEQVYNFSPALAPFGMILIGMFFRWLYEVFRAGFRVNPVIATATYASWWYTGVFGSGESNWATGFNGMLTFTLFLFVTFGLLGLRRFRDANQASAGGRV